MLTTTSVLVGAWVESQIQAGATPHISWQVLCYVLLTAAEVMVSITALEFAYTQAPNRMKSVIMNLYLVSVAIGNFAPMVVNFWNENPDGSTKLGPVGYYIFFSCWMVGGAVAFVFAARKYKPKTYLQEEISDAEADIEMR